MILIIIVVRIVINKMLDAPSTYSNWLLSKK